MRTSLFTEFKEGTALARTDLALTRQLLRHYQTSTLLPARRGLCRSTCVVLAWNIQQARVVFPHDPALIRGVISGAPCANALAAWGDQQRHWIVVTEGLMRALHDAAEAHAARLLAAFPAAFASVPGQRLLAATPLQGFDTMLGALLYFGAMSFVASHELGHHLAGHGAYFSGQAHKGRWDVPQALERQADAIGVAAALLSVSKLMRRLFTAAGLPPSGRQQQQALIAIVFTAGVLTSAARLLPAGFDFNGAHSPNAYRMLRIAATLLRPLRSLLLLDDATRKSIRRQCLEAVLGPAQHVRGMQQALHAPAFQAYTSQLDAGFRLFKDNLPEPS
ncbi:ImmA/IrrE family metallo-endopeptidase [Massilia sp. S19_KUP03_FR1]|uniref:ImmA/IrrE family metallo-endopeptidase n=1 Tax=Massilia sp. S19_KUP03_FR1 TaxID=3025503 RepID=UPI002FCDB745